MTRLRAYLDSPLARRPGLLRRKIAERLQLRGPPVIPSVPSVPLRPIPRVATDRLRAWVRNCDAHDAPMPPSRVFQQDFDPSLLDSVCRNGPTDRPDLTGDLKLVWDYGRGHAFALNALRSAASPGELAGGIRGWLDANADRKGPAWTSAMDIAIRAVNWIAADAALDGRLAAAFGPDAWRSLLWEHACRIDHGLEVRLLTTNNHYLAELLGLAWLGELFAESRPGRRWRAFARAEMSAALLAQTYADGGLHEASLPYHVFVTEMALLFLAVHAESMPARWMERLQRMVDIAANASSPRGEVFQVGDSDGGRILPLEFVSRSLGHAAVVTRLAAQCGLEVRRSADALYHESGWAILRKGPVECHLEFGGWGPHGLAGHAHNDLLSVCINWNGAPLVVDPGSYLYTPAPAARNRYRATAAHNTVQFDAREQSPLPPADRGHVFEFRGPRAPCCILSAEARQIAIENRHAADGTALRHTRSLALSDDGLLISDTMLAPAGTAAVWSFHLAPGIAVEPQEDRLLLNGPGGRVALAWSDPGLKMSIEADEVSPYYGSRMAAPCLRFRGILVDQRVFTFRWQSA